VIQDYRVEEWLTEAQAWLKSRRARNLPAYLLRQPGFTVKLLSARVFGAGQLGPEYDHMLLLVEMHERWIADVGFGDSFLQPLRLDDPAQQAQEQGGCAYRLLATEAQMVLQQSKEGVWNSQYAFALEPRQLAEFDAMCDYQQTSPASNFTRKAVCSMATPQGRVSLSNRRLILSTDGQREEREIADAGSYRVALKYYFDIELDAGAHIERLMDPLATLPNLQS